MPPSIPFPTIPRRLLIPTVLLIFAIVSLSSLRYTGSHRNALRYFSGQSEASGGDTTSGVKVSEENVKDVYNSTLGFEKVFVINLSERADKLDDFSLISSLSGFHADVIEGVHGSDIPDKALPSLEGLPEDTKTRNTVVGCWRAHLNFARTLVNDRISSALVLEDDADWDIHLKEQLAMFALGTQFVTGSTGKSSSPYGDDWDLLWIGHCGSTIKPDSYRRFMIENDNTTVPPSRRFNVGEFPDIEKEGVDKSTRFVYRASGGVCTAAYALSLRGALKYLRAQATRTTFLPIDLGMNEMCESISDFKCIGVYPQYVFGYKGAGRTYRDTDILDLDVEEIRDKGLTWNVVYSTRLNVDHILAGDDAAIERQWPEDPEILGPARIRTVAGPSSR